MPRPLRIEYPNACYHVMNYGANQRVIFHSDQQRQLFLSLLGDISVTFGVEIISYCLLSQHYHLLIRTPRGNLARAMRHLNGVYTQKFNRLENSEGALFRGRYRALLIEPEAYLARVSRYIHFVPVVEKLVKEPEDYRWSSYKAFIGKMAQPDWLRPKYLPCDYKNFIAQGVDAELAAFYSKKALSPILGSTNFKQQILSQLDDKQLAASQTDINRSKNMPSIKKIMQVTAEFFDIKVNQLTHSIRGQENWPRTLAMYICRKPHGYKLTEIAAAFQAVSHTGVSAAIRRCNQALEEQKALRAELTTILQKVN